MIPDLENHLLQSTVFAGVAWLLTLALRKNRASVRHWIWLSASIKFLLPFPLLAAVGQWLRWRTAGILGAPHLGTPHIGGYISVILFVVWLCGFAANALVWCRQWWRTQRVRRSAASLPLNSPVPIMSSPGRSEPGVFGVFRPCLLLPEGITNHVTAAQLEAVLAHELCHVRRRDNLKAAVHMVVEALFWFHPLVWWVEARLMEERERACDEEVLRAASDPDAYAAVYAEGILNVCRFHLNSELPCMSTMTGGNLRKRLEAIMSYREPHQLTFAKKIVVLVGAALATVASLSIGVINGPVSLAQSRPVVAWSAIPGNGLVTSYLLIQSKVQPPPASTARFEVASIKPAAPGARPGRLAYAAYGARINTDPGLLSIQSISLKDLIAAAYGIETYQISGGPAWVDSDQFEVNAKSASPASREELLRMLPSLLSDRFRLEFHTETKKSPAYALTVAQTGKLQRIPSGEESKPGFMRPNSDMPSLARYLTRSGADMPVIDKTGLTGQFKLDLDNEKIMQVAVDISGAPPSNEGIYRGTVEFIERQWGLKLVPTNAPVEVLVIDRVNRSSAN
jgi:bla regulator protein BlaR1